MTACWVFSQMLSLYIHKKIRQQQHTNRISIRCGFAWDHLLQKLRFFFKWINWNSQQHDTNQNTSNRHDLNRIRPGHADLIPEISAYVKASQPSPHSSISKQVSKAQLETADHFINTTTPVGFSCFKPSILKQSNMCFLFSGGWGEGRGGPPARMLTLWILSLEF